MAMTARTSVLEGSVQYVIELFVARSEVWIIWILLIRDCTSWERQPHPLVASHLPTQCPEPVSQNTH